jgi:protoporphyrinogen oxidase
MASERWAIIGGGFLGMTLALRLAQHGKNVTLFEAAPSLGGLASAWKLGDVVWDRHYHVTLASDRYLRSLLSELGLEQELQWVRTRTGFYADSKFYSMSNTLEFLQFPPLSLLDKIRLGTTIFYASKVKDWKRLESKTAVEWLRRWSGESTVEKIWLPLLRSKLGENAEEVSAAFIWATIARMYAARRTGLKTEMFGYVPGGYARVLDRFADRLARVGVRVELGLPARQIVQNGGLKLELNDGTRQYFDRIVVTAPAPIAAQLCPELTSKEKQLLQKIRYQGVICASLLMKKPLTNFYITNIIESWVPYTAVIEMSALVDRKHFNGNALVYLPKYVPSNSPEFELTDEVLRDKFVGALHRMYPKFDARDILSFRVSRARHVMAIPTLNYSEQVPATATSVPGLYTVNSSQIVNGTLNVNETLQLAERAAGELLAANAGNHSHKVVEQVSEAFSQSVVGSR